MSTNTQIIGMENVLSLILVNENIRPAFLFQPRIKNNKETNDTIIEKMKEEFPELHYSDKYQNYQGVIISKKNFNHGKNISNEQMGKILGYPCYKGFSSLDMSKPIYIAEVKIVSNVGDFTVLLNTCANKSKIGAFQKFAERVKAAVTKEKYMHLMSLYGISMEIDTVKVVFTKEVTPQSILDKLIRGADLNEEDKKQILQIIFNIGFSIEFQLFYEDNYQYDNPVHRGIMITMLLNFINNVLEPFIPLFQYPEQDKKVGLILQALETQLMESIKKTRIDTVRQKRSTRKNK